MGKKFHLKSAMVAFAACFVTLSLLSSAFAQQKDGSVLFVAPHRLIIPSDTDVDVLNVSNKSDRARRYDILLIDQAMNSDGVTERKDSFAYSLKHIVKFVPKRFTLNPGEKQTIRIQVQRSSSLAAGDYHSHFLFREVPLSVKDKETLTQAQSADPKASFEIRTLYGIAVPVVVQHGKIESDITMSQPSIATQKDGGRVLKIDFTRTGNAEAAGKISAEYVPAGSKEAVSVINPQWVRMYHEIDTVHKSFPLSHLPANAKNGKIVVYMMKDENDPKKTVQKEIALSN